MCELKLKTEKFENIHTQKNKKEKIRKKKEKKKKNRYTSVQRNKKEEGKYKGKKKYIYILRHVILKSITGNKH